MHELWPAELGCRLTADGLSEQRRRLERLRPAVRELRRGESGFEVSFGDKLDEALLLELVNTERSCCPFYELDWRSDERTLVVAVADASLRPALDALAESFAP
jgi:hypothetical protein